MKKYVLASLIGFLVCAPLGTAAKAESELIARAVGGFQFELIPGGPEAIKATFEAVRSFGEEHHFAVRFAPTRPGDYSIVELWRSEIRLTVVNVFSPNRFQVAVYKNVPQLFSQEAQDYVMMELVRKLSLIPDIVFRS